MKKKCLASLLLLLSAFSYSQVVINELDSDNFGTDDKEFIELKSQSPFFSLDGYVVVLYNGNPAGAASNTSYYTIDLSGHATDSNGIFLIGSALVTPNPDKIIPTNIIQNGQDAVALYSSSTAFDFPNSTFATSQNLADALVYETSDPDAAALLSILGASGQINENANGLSSTQSIQRKNNGTYQVKAPTPGEDNDAAVPINRISITIPATPDAYTEGAVLPITFSTETAVSALLEFTFSLDNGAFDTYDFTGSTSIAIPAGSSSFTANITLRDDILEEGDEFLIIRFGGLPEGFTTTTDDIEVRVLDNDYASAAWGTPLNPTYGIVANTIPDGYYASLEGKSGAFLKQAVQDIIANPNAVRVHNYGDAIEILQKADENPLDSNEVWLMYAEKGRLKSKFQTTSSSVGTWNREHIYPQSRGGFKDGTSSTPNGIALWVPGSAGNIKGGHADAHALRAEDGPENSSRGNKDYGLNAYNGPAGNAGSWKGDVARAVFYMAVRYNGLDVVNGNPSDTTDGQLGDLATLLQWNRDDPADDFEMNRNNYIYTWQFNRNPFIDYPDLADRIWGSKTGEAWSARLSDAGNSALSFLMYPNPAKDYITISGLNQQSTIAVYNLSGMELYRSTFSGTTEIKLDLASGLYMAKISSDSKTIVKKIIVR